MKVPDSGSLSSSLPRFPTRPQRPVRSRISIQDSVYHQPADGQPTVKQSKFTRWLDSDESPYTRPKAVAGPEWSPIDIGWVKETGCGMLILENVEGRFTQVRPTDEEKADADKRVIEVGIVGKSSDVEPFAAIRPGESCRYEPLRTDLVRVRCVAGSARYVLTAVPL